MEAFDPFKFDSENFVDSSVDKDGFPVDCFPEVVATGQHVQLDGAESDQGVATIEISEEMTATYYTKIRQCSVKVTGSVKVGTISAGAKKNGSVRSWDVSLLDPKQQIDEITPKSTDCATAIEGRSNSFRLQEQPANKSNSPLLEYSCDSSLRPVPMLCSTTQIIDKGMHHIGVALRVNPRNKNPLVNGVILVSVPESIMGENAKVLSVGNSIGKGEVESSWNGVTRILCWTLGELYSGATVEFDVQVPVATSEDEPADVAFPILLRYDSHGCLLSDVKLNVDSKTNTAHKFRVYHREV